MIQKNKVGDTHQKKILLLENSSGASQAHAKRISRYGFNVVSALAELQMLKTIKRQLADVDLIIINTNKALKELGGEQFLELLGQNNVPVLILSDGSKLGQELNIDRETSFNIIDQSSDTDAIDSTIQRVLNLEGGDLSQALPAERISDQAPQRSHSRQFFESSDEGIVFFDASTRRLHEANNAMEKLTGIPMYMLIGKNIGQIKFFESLNIDDNLLDEIIAHERVHYTNCMAEQADGTQILITVHGEIYKSGSRSMIRCTLRPTVQEAPSKAKLSDELQKKNVMIHELQHRTKNTFAMITGLVELKSLSSESEESKQMLKELSLRIQSISELYKLLYENDSNDVNMANYCHVITKSVIGESKDISIIENVDNIVVGTKKATSLGLILVELLYNIMKYAFPEGSEEKRIRVDLDRKPSGMKLTVSDNGIGFPENYSIEGSSSSGLSLVHMLADQLKGAVSIDSKNGTTVTVDINS